MQNDKSKFKKEFIKRLINFSIKIIYFTDKAKQTKNLSFSLVDQLLRSSTSIGANVVEAKASSSKRDYLKYFQIALKSANETLYWLILFRETDKNNLKQEIINLYKEAEEISKILASSVLTLKGKR